MSTPWSASNMPRRSRPGSRSSAAITNTVARATPSQRLIGTIPGSAKEASARAGAADGSALRVAAAEHRLDETEVALAPPVQDRDPLVLGVDEHEERVPELLHPRDGVL